MLTQIHDVLRESVVIDDLDAGGGLCIVPRQGRRCHAVLSISFGALHESGQALGEPAGIAHFLEHRLFEKPTGDIGERFTAIGADIDAQTGFTTTSYSLTCGAEVFPQAIELLFELVRAGHFPQESVGRERDIIGHEIQLFEDNLEWVSFQMLLSALYPDQRIAIDIAGTPESLLAIDPALLDRCHRRHYRPSAIQLLACGPIEAAALLDISNQGMATWPERGPELPMPTSMHRAKADPGRRNATMSLARPRRLLGFADERPRQGLPLMRHELALEMTLDILFGPGSEFFSRHYESGLLDGESFGGEVHMDESYGFCLLGGDADDPGALERAILEELANAPSSNWIETDFDRALRRAYGDMVCRWEDVEGTVGFIESAREHDCHPFALTDLYSGPGAISVDDIRRCLDGILQPDRVAVATVGAPEP